MRRALLALAVILPSAGCDGPLLHADLEIPEVELTLPAQQFPGSVAAPSLGCATTTAACVAIDLTYDLGRELELRDRAGTEYELRLTSLSIELTATEAGDLGGVASAALLAYPPGGGAPVTVARYQRSAAEPAPTAIALTGVPGLDLAPLLDAGLLRLRVELTYDARTPAFQADVTAGFHLDVELDYGALL